jgi:hypothetical protein
MEEKKVGMVRRSQISGCRGCSWAGCFLFFSRYERKDEAVGVKAVG